MHFPGIRTRLSCGASPGVARVGHSLEKDYVHARRDILPLSCPQGRFRLLRRMEPVQVPDREMTAAWFAGEFAQDDSLRLVAADPRRSAPCKPTAVSD